VSKWQIPADWIDVTEQRAGTTTTIVGAPPRKPRKPLIRPTDETPANAAQVGPTRNSTNDAQ
jgi:hypothetical protein